MPDVGRDPRETRYCGFCKKSEFAVGKLITATDEVFICSECTFICLNIIIDNSAEKVTTLNTTTPKLKFFTSIESIQNAHELRLTNEQAKMKFDEYITSYASNTVTGVEIMSAAYSVLEAMRKDFGLTANQKRNREIQRLQQEIESQANKIKEKTRLYKEKLSNELLTPLQRELERLSLV